MKRLGAFLLAGAVLVGTACPTYAAQTAVTVSSSYTARTAEYVYKKVTAPSFGSIGGEWAVIGLARSSFGIPDEYFGKYLVGLSEYLKENKGILSSSKNTEYSRVVLALSALGIDAENFAGYDLTKPLVDFDGTMKQGLNGAVFALLALDSCAAADENIRDKYISALTDGQNSDGGWDISSYSSDSSDADTTAMVLQVLAKYSSRENVAAAIESGIDFLSDAQLETGGFMTSGLETCESTAQVLIALSELGIPHDDPKFVKNGKTPLDALKSFMNPDGSFKHTADSRNANQMATEQALCALAAVERFNGSKNSFYSMSDAVAVSAEYSSFSNRDPDVKRVEVKYSVDFSDVSDSDDGFSAINELASRGIINGRENGIFDPEGNMTRAEFATIAVRALGLEAFGVDSFSDVTVADWFYGYVGTAYSKSIVNGMGNGTFSPNGTITREEAAVMVARAARLCGFDISLDQNSIRDILSQFPDYRESSEWAREALAFCYDEGILDESALNILSKTAITRHEVAIMFFNLLEGAELL